MIDCQTLPFISQLRRHKDQGDFWLTIHLFQMLLKILNFSRFGDINGKAFHPRIFNPLHHQLFFTIIES